jgi:SOS response regulatory protein OraA/RecX
LLKGPLSGLLLFGSPVTTRRARSRAGLLPERLQPGVVTSIAAADRRSARFSLEVRETVADGTGASHSVTAASARYIVSAEIVAEFALAPGSFISDAVAGDLLAQVRELALFDKGVSLLAMRGLSERDLGLRLRRLGGEREEVARAIERLCGLGLADDVRYAHQVAAMRGAAGVSGARIARDLRRKGIAAAVADAAAREATEGGEEVEFATALRLVERRLQSVSRLDAASARGRLTAFLVRRGYPHALAARAVKQALSSS